MLAIFAQTTPPATTQSATNVINSFNAVGQNIVSTCAGLGQNLYFNVLGPEALHFAMAVLPYVMVAEMMFIGFRIMLAQGGVLDQAARYILITIIVSSILVVQFPQRLLIGTIGTLENAGISLSSDIINIYTSTSGDTYFQQNYTANLAAAQSTQSSASSGSSTTSPTKVIPVLIAWSSWIGNPTPTNPSDYDLQYKYSSVYIYKHIYQGAVLSTSEQAVYQNLQQMHSQQNPQVTLNQWIDQANISNPPSSFQSILALGTSLFNFMQMLSPLTLLGIAQSVAPILLAGWIVPSLTASSILGAAYLVFYILLALGITIVPFTYFKTLEKSWNNWLRVVLGVSLVPFFYHVFAAIGFVFAAEIFNTLFPPNATGVGPIIETAIKNAMALAVEIQMSWGAAGGNTNDSVHSVIGFLLGLFIFFSRSVVGVVIISGFITSGSLFAYAAPRIALQWERGFASAELMENVQERLSSMQNSISTGIALGIATGMDRVGAIGGGVRSVVSSLAGK